MNSTVKRYLVFTSAGDQSEVKRWWGRGNNDFDIMVVYYGDNEFLYKESTTYFFERKGSKFQNLAFIFQSKPEIFDQYDAFFLMDDDVVIESASISRLFRLRFERGLQLLQPAFLRNGKISHAITEAEPWSSLRYTNFVEVTCPLFSAAALKGFVPQYDARLVGWGVDYLYSHYVASEYGPKAIGVVDCVPCRNPFDLAKKAEVRPIDALQSWDARRSMWNKVKAERGLPEDVEQIEVITKERASVSQSAAVAIRIYYGRCWYWLGRQIQSILRLQ